MSCGSCSSSSVSCSNDAANFLTVKSGDFVLIAEITSHGDSAKDSWWIGKVISCIGGARDPDVNSLFQVANIDTGSIRIINADLVREIVKRKTKL